MHCNTTGSQNVGVGSMALDHATTTSNSTAVGYHALSELTTGVSNTAVGSVALDACTTGDANTAVGLHSSGALTTGDNNTTVGMQSGNNLTTGDNNLFLGHDAGQTGSPIGNMTTQSNNICLGDNNIGSSYIKVDWTVTSDERDKTDIADFTKGLSIINSLRPVSYKWDMRSNYSDGNPDGSKKDSKTNIGLIAQEVLTVEKANGYGDTADNMILTNINVDGNYGMQYSRLIPILINAIKELSTKVTALEAG